MKKSKAFGLWILALIVLSIFVSGEKITLQAVDTENLDDSHIYEWDSDANYGSLNYMACYTSSTTPYIKFNISSIPAESTITDATLGLYINWLENGPDEVYAYHIDNASYKWTEEALTWDNRALESNHYNSTAIDSATASNYGEYITWNITKAVKHDYNNGKKNTSIILSENDWGGAYIEFRTKEAASLRPYLNITYTQNSPVNPNATVTSFYNSSQTNQSITLAWSCTGNCTRYELFCSSTLKYNGTSTSSTVSGLSPNTGYFCYLYARYNSTVYDYANGTFYTKQNSAQSGGGNETTYKLTLTAPDSEVLDDTYVNQGAPTTNYGTQNYMNVYDTTSVSYIKFNITKLPDGATIKDATLGIYVSWTENGPDSVYAHHINNYSYRWTEETLTWNSRAISSKNYNSTAMSSTTASNYGEYITWNITKGIRQDYTNNRHNSSIILSYDDSGSAYADLRTKEATNLRPYLNITYTLSEEGSEGYSISSIHVSGSNLANDTNTNWTGTATISGSGHKYNTTWYNTSSKEPVLVMDFNAQNAKDHSGYRNNGTVTGATYRSTGGNDGSGAYNFTSSSTYITVPDHSSLDLADDFTVELWFKSAGTGFRNLLSKDNTGSEQNLNYFLGVNDDHNVYAMIGDGSIYDAIVDTVNVNDNSFHHAVLRHKNGNMSLYVDGVRHSASQTVTTPYTNAAPLLIGKWGGAGFNGIIDSVKIYNYALSDKQVNNNYLRNQKLSYLDAENGESWNYNVVASNGSTYINSNYKFLISSGESGNQSSGNFSISSIHVFPSNVANDTNTNWTGSFSINGTGRKLNTTWYNTSGKEPVLVMDFNIQNAKDHSSYRNNGTVTGATYRSTGGNDGSGAYNYTSSSTYITIADDISLDLSDDFTVELWFKAAGTGFRNLLSKDNTGSEQNLNYFLGVNDDHNVWAMIGDGSTFDTIVDTVSVNDNAFHHAVLRHKNGNMSLFVDGVRHSASQTVTTPYTNAAPLLIGKWGGAGFNGIIDSVKIYNYALSDKQVNNNYNKNQKLSYLETENGESWNYNVVASNGSTYTSARYLFETENDPNDNITALEYDSIGNLVSDESYHYEYNSFNQLYQIRIDNSSGRLLERYYYDEAGQRAVKVHYFIDGTNETVYYLGSDFVRVVNASGTFDTTYFYHGSVLVAERKPNGNYLYYHQDHLGSSSLITNSSGGVVEKTTYEPYGSVVSGGSKSRYDYTNKELDQTNLMYYGARYYNPEVGMFTQADTLLPDIYDPQQLNRYSYVRNNPYRYVDHDGKLPALVLYGIVEGAIDFLGLTIDSLAWAISGSDEDLNALTLDLIDLFSGPLSNPGPSGPMYKLWLNLKATKDAVSTGHTAASTFEDILEDYFDDVDVDYNDRTGEITVELEHKGKSQSKKTFDEKPNLDDKTDKENKKSSSKNKRKKESSNIEISTFRKIYQNNNVPSSITSNQPVSIDTNIASSYDLVYRNGAENLLKYSTFYWWNEKKEDN